MIHYDYVVEGTTKDGQTLTGVGNGTMPDPDATEYSDDGTIFAEASSAAVGAFYSSEIDKTSRQLEQVVVTIRNVRYTE